MSEHDMDPPIEPLQLADEEIFAAHQGGKVHVESTIPLENTHDLSVAYTPGVARVCSAIQDDPGLARQYTWIGNTVAVITDGTAVLGLGDIGPQAALPVMEGKAELFRRFGGLNAIPIALSTKDVDEVIQVIKGIAPTFGGINLEDISAPRCFEIERRLDAELDIPVFHDDQHGTAIVILAGLRNACTITGREIRDLRVVISGAGAAGVAATKMLIAAGVHDIVVVDSRGIIHPDRTPLNAVKQHLATITNPRGIQGGIAEALVGADTFIGVSAGRIAEQDVARMAPDPILFSLANPDPEIPYDIARRYGAVVATGRSDLPNQINNVLAFPGIFKGALSAGAHTITPAMKLAASHAIAGVLGDDIHAEKIVPAPLDDRVCPAVATAVARAARLEHKKEGKK